MSTPEFFFPIPMIVKHILPSGAVENFTILVSDTIDAAGTRYAKYANGAKVRLSALRFIQLELAQADLSRLEPTPLPGEVARRDRLH